MFQFFPCPQQVRPFVSIGVRGGFGFIRILTEYAHDATFEQEICIERVRNPLAVVVDPDFRKADGSDIKYAFIVDEIPEDEFERLYPDAKKGTDFDVGDLGWEANWLWAS